MTSLTFIFLDYGYRKLAHLDHGEHGIEIEIQYCISTLKADHSAPYKIVIYTDKPDLYSNLGLELQEVHGGKGTIGQHGYVYRLKPYVLLDALGRFGGACVFLDSDMFIYPGFAAGIASLVEQGPVLWEATKLPPRSFFPASLAECPHHRRHKPLTSHHPHGNSGVIGLKTGWGEALMEDALWLIDCMLDAGNTWRTLEQSAILEAFWLHGMQPAGSTQWVNHYCTNSQKRYMHWQIKRLIAELGRPLPPKPPSIKLTAPRVKAYQFYWDLKRWKNGLPRH